MSDNKVSLDIDGKITLDDSGANKTIDGIQKKLEGLKPNSGIGAAFSNFQNIPNGKMSFAEMNREEFFFRRKADHFKSIADSMEKAAKAAVTMNNMGFGAAVSGGGNRNNNGGAGNNNNPPTGGGGNLPPSGGGGANGAIGSVASLLAKGFGLAAGVALTDSVVQKIIHSGRTGRLMDTASEQNFNGVSSRQLAAGDVSYLFYGRERDRARKDASAEAMGANAWTAFKGLETIAATIATTAALVSPVGWVGAGVTGVAMLAGASRLNLLDDITTEAPWNWGKAARQRESGYYASNYQAEIDKDAFRKASEDSYLSSRMSYLDFQRKTGLNESSFLSVLKANGKFRPGQFMDSASNILNYGGTTKNAIGGAGSSLGEMINYNWGEGDMTRGRLGYIGMSNQQNNEASKRFIAEAQSAGLDKSQQTTIMKAILDVLSRNSGVVTKDVASQTMNEILGARPTNTGLGLQQSLAAREGLNSAFSSTTPRAMAIKTAYYMKMGYSGIEAQNLARLSLDEVRKSTDAAFMGAYNKYEKTHPGTSLPEYRKILEHTNKEGMFGSHTYQGRDVLSEFEKHKKMKKGTKEYNDQTLLLTSLITGVGPEALQNSSFAEKEAFALMIEGRSPEQNKKLKNKILSGGGTYSNLMDKQNQALAGSEIEAIALGFKTLGLATEKTTKQTKEFGAVMVDIVLKMAGAVRQGDQKEVNKQIGISEVTSVTHRHPELQTTKSKIHTNTKYHGKGLD